MGLINYLGESKIIKRICELLNVTDVQDGEGHSLVDENGIAIVTGGGGGASALDDLSDVSITNPTDYQALVYDDTNDEWQNKSFSTVAISGSYNDLSNKPSLATVATSGDYEDLSNKPIVNQVKQNATTANRGFAVLLSGSEVTDPLVTETAETRKSLGLRFNPGTNTLALYGTQGINARDGRGYETGDTEPAVTGVSLISLGNNIPDGGDHETSDENSRGRIRLYSNNTRRVLIEAQDDIPNSDRIVKIPGKNGLLAMDAEVLHSTGGTLKASSGNTTLKIEGASSSDYGQIVLQRGSYTGTIFLLDNLTSNRNYYLPNLGGAFVIASSDYAGTTTGNTNETWGSLFARFRDAYLTNGVVRRNIIRVSLLDGKYQLMFHCVQWRSSNEQMWSCDYTQSTSSGHDWWEYTFRTNASTAFLGKYGLSQTTAPVLPSFEDLTSTNANGATLTLL